VKKRSLDVVPPAQESRGVSVHYRLTAFAGVPSPSPNRTYTRTRALTPSPSLPLSLARRRSHLGSRRSCRVARVVSCRVVSVSCALIVLPGLWRVVGAARRRRDAVEARARLGAYNGLMNQKESDVGVESRRDFLWVSELGRKLLLSTPMSRLAVFKGVMTRRLNPSCILLRSIFSRQGIKE
jgi:hypothetical protein